MAKIKIKNVGEGLDPPSAIWAIRKKMGMVHHSRKATRIPGYDYSSCNYYFVTICTDGKKCIFGSVDQLNAFGEIAKEDLQKLPEHYKTVHVDNFIVMPNHIHAIIVTEPENTVSLNYIVGLYKSGVSKKIRQKQSNITIWQRSYHDHIIRNQREYEQIWQYVECNAEKWKEDRYYIPELL